MAISTPHDPPGNIFRPLGPAKARDVAEPTPLKRFIPDAHPGFIVDKAGNFSTDKYTPSSTQSPEPNLRK